MHQPGDLECRLSVVQRWVVIAKVQLNLSNTPMQFCFTNSFLFFDCESQILLQDLQRCFKIAFACERYSDSFTSGNKNFKVICPSCQFQAAFEKRDCRIVVQLPLLYNSEIEQQSSL